MIVWGQIDRRDFLPSSYAHTSATVSYHPRGNCKIIIYFRTAQNSLSHPTLHLIEQRNMNKRRVLKTNNSAPPTNHYQTPTTVWRISISPPTNYDKQHQLVISLITHVTPHIVPNPPMDGKAPRRSSVLTDAFQLHSLTMCDCISALSEGGTVQIRRKFRRTITRLSAPRLTSHFHYVQGEKH